MNGRGTAPHVSQWEPRRAGGEAEEQHGRGRLAKRHTPPPPAGHVSERLLCAVLTRAPARAEHADLWGGGRGESPE